MNSQPRMNAMRIMPTTSWLKAALAASLVVLAHAATSRGEVTRVYSFENGDPEGFGPNGGEFEVTPDTIGATHGTGSLKIDVGLGGFVGALTLFIPLEIGNPPGVDFVTFDVTLPADYPGTFANVGVIMFGQALNMDPPQFGLQVQFANEAPLAALDAGTHLNRRVELSFSVGPYRVGESFNAIVGPTEPADITQVTGFQLYINKNVLTPITSYIDNIRVGQIEADYDDDGDVDGTDLAIWGRNFGETPTGFDGDSDGADFLVWQRQFGMTTAATPAPEPSSIVAAATAALALAWRRRRLLATQGN